MNYTVFQCITSRDLIGHYWIKFGDLRIDPDSGVATEVNIKIAIEHFHTAGSDSGDLSRNKYNLFLGTVYTTNV